MWHCLQRDDGPLLAVEKGIFFVYYALALVFVFRFILPVLFQGKLQMAKFTLPGPRRTVMLIHGVSGTVGILIPPFVDLNSVMQQVFISALIIHTITAFIQIPNMSGSKIASMSTCLYCSVMNTYYLYSLVVLRQNEPDELCLTTYRAFHALSGFTHTRFFVIFIEVLQLFDNTYAIGMYLAGFSAAVFSHGVYAVPIFLFFTTVTALAVKGWSGISSTLAQYYKTPAEIIPHLNARTHRNTWQERSKEIHLMIGDGRLTAEMTPLDVVFLLLDKDNDGFISESDLRDAIGRSDLIGDAGLGWKATTKEDLGQKYPLLVSTLYSEYWLVLSRLAAETMFEMQTPQTKETRDLMKALSNKCPYRTTELRTEKEELVRSRKFRSVPAFENSEHKSVCQFCQGLEKKK
jgi:hypothetical protein